MSRARQQSDTTVLDKRILSHEIYALSVLVVLYLYIRRQYIKRSRLHARHCSRISVCISSSPSRWQTFNVLRSIHPVFSKKLSHGCTKYCSKFQLCREQFKVIWSERPILRILHKSIDRIDRTILHYCTLRNMQNKSLYPITFYCTWIKIIFLNDKLLCKCKKTAVYDNCGTCICQCIMHVI